MINRRLMFVGAGLATMATTVPATAQPRPGVCDLPVKQVVLFSSGVGYFEREGQVDGNCRLDLQFHQTNINDILKSLILSDPEGKIGVVNYDNRNPIDFTLKSFALDLTKNPTMADLLNQARGEKIDVILNADGKTAGITDTKITGLIVGIEKTRKVIGKDTIIESAQLNLLTDDGLRGISLGHVEKVKFNKASLEQEFRKALEVLATGHDKQKKTVSLNITGSKPRNVKVGYVTENPIWKTSYRVSLGKDNKVWLQGWALVENTTDEDWNNVDLKLVSGRPISFQMDLYQPLFVTRPTVDLELFASLRPPVYEGNMNLDAPAMGSPKAESDGWGSENAKKDSDRLKEAQSFLRRNQTYRGESGGGAPGRKPLDMKQGVDPATFTSSLGDYFQYVLRQPVSLPRQKSALLPIMNQEVDGCQRVSIYNERVQAKFPLLGLQFMNSTGNHLSQGPITVFDEDCYAGDARIQDLQPKEKRLFSYAVDLGTEVKPSQTEKQTLTKVKVVKGVAQLTFKREETKSYEIKNRSQNERTVLIEHPLRTEFTVAKKPKDTEETRDLYRFPVKCEPNKTVKFDVLEERTLLQQTQISNSSSDTINLIFNSKDVSQELKDAIDKSLKMKSDIGEVQRELRAEEKALADVERDQNRVRENLKILPQNHKLYNEYLQTWSEQEESVKKINKSITALRKKIDQQQKAYDDYLTKLDVE